MYETTGKISILITYCIDVADQVDDSANPKDML